MVVKVILTPRAIEDLREIVTFIARDNPDRAFSFGNELIDRALSVGAFPQAGRTVPEWEDPDMREVIHGTYRIVYELYHERKVAYILRFWHAARGSPESA